MIARMLLSMVVAALCAVPASAQLFYDASDKHEIPNDPQNRAFWYNVGPSRILFDDVTVPGPGSPALPGTLFNIKKVTFGITRRPNAPAVEIFPYFAQLFPDANQSGGAGDGPNHDPLSPTLIAPPVALAQNGAGWIDGMEISFGDGVSTLFNVPGATAALESKYRSFALGLRFSTAGDDNGWTVANHPTNLDVLWDYLSDSSFAEFSYDDDDDYPPVIGTNYIKVEGLVLSEVPADATIDGRVDIADLHILATNYLTAGDFVHGDFNFDGFVDASDLAILAANWQSGVDLGQALTSLGLPANVPEPASFGLLLALVPLLRRRRD